MSAPGAETSGAHSISGATELYGIIGNPIAQSLSPILQGAAFRAAGLDAVYLPFPVLPEHLEAAVAGLQAIGVRGFNVTVPHKQAVLPLLDSVLPDAQAIGAANTVRIDGGHLVGTNTDGSGFLRSLSEDLAWSAAGKSVLLLGAGGSARAIANALLGAGVEHLVIANRTRERAEVLATACRAWAPQVDVRGVALDAIAGSEAHLLVNSTSVGMGDGAIPIALDAVHVREAVVDIVYHPLETPLLTAAQAAGLPCANGLGMLLHQGAAAFEFWTGRTAPVEAMRAALMGAIAARH